MLPPTSTCHRRPSCRRLPIEHWGLLDQPLLYLSVAFRRAQAEYYARLAAVRSDGDWEGWVAFFLECVQDAADDGVGVARELHALVGRHRSRILSHDRSTVAALRLLELLPSDPVVSRLIPTTPVAKNRLMPETIG